MEKVVVSRGGAKNTDFGVLGKDRPEESKLFCFFVSVGTSSGKCEVLVESVAISRGSRPKNKLFKSLWFLGISSGKCKALVENVAIFEVTRMPKTIWSFGEEQA